MSDAERAAWWESETRDILKALWQLSSAYEVHEVTKCALDLRKKSGRSESPPEPSVAEQPSEPGQKWYCAQCMLNGSGQFALIDGKCVNPKCVLRNHPSRAPAVAEQPETPHNYDAWNKQRALDRDGDA